MSDQARTHAASENALDGAAGKHDAVTIAASEVGGQRATVGRCAAALEEFVEELHRDYERWYARSVRRCAIAYFALQMLVITVGFSAAVVAAIVTDSQFPGADSAFWRLLLILLPLVGALAATALQTFRVHERWQLRERGRLGFQSLVNEGRQRFASAVSDEDACRRIHEDLRTRCDKIEQQQSHLFFSTTPPDPVGFQRN